MSAASRKLQVGANVITDFSGKITAHRITEVLTPSFGSSGISFMVTPMVPRSSGGWIDADWFEPAPQTAPDQAKSAPARNEKD